MDLSAAASIVQPDAVQQLTAVGQASAVSDVGTAVIKQILDVQQELATQILASLGVGGNLDITA